MTPKQIDIEAIKTRNDEVKALFTKPGEIPKKQVDPMMRL